jgi:hypothetical protein
MLNSFLYWRKLIIKTFFNFCPITNSAHSVTNIFDLNNQVSLKYTLLDWEKTKVCVDLDRHWLFSKNTYFFEKRKTPDSKMSQGVPRSIITHAQRVCRMYKKALRTTEMSCSGKYDHSFSIYFNFSGFINGNNPNIDILMLPVNY